MDFHVLFVGDGARLKFCKDLATELSVSHRTIFLGLQEKVGSILAQSSIVVMSSHYEGFGRSAIEGMAAGKPVIASNVPGLSQVVEGAGLLFEVGDYKMLASLILKLTTNELFYKQVSRNCLDRANQFDIKKMVKGYEQVYEGLFLNK